MDELWEENRQVLCGIYMRKKTRHHMLSPAHGLNGPSLKQRRCLGSNPVQPFRGREEGYRASGTKGIKMIKGKTAKNKVAVPQF